MRFARLAPLAAVVAAGCGGGSEQSASKLPGPDAPGKQVIVENNCLACHQIGSEGTAEPGGDLSKIGAQSSAADIRRAIVNPPAGMPEYDRVSAADREAMVAYLAGLR